MAQYWCEGNHGGDEGDGGKRVGYERHILREHPHSMWENYFSGD